MHDIILYADKNLVNLSKGFCLDITTILNNNNFVGYLSLQEEFEAYNSASWDEEYSWLSSPHHFV